VPEVSLLPLLCSCFELSKKDGTRADPCQWARLGRSRLSGMMPHRQRFGASPLVRISLSYVYDLAVTIEPLLHVQAGTYQDLWEVLWNAQKDLDGFINNSVFSVAVRSSRANADTLLSILENMNADPIIDRQVNMSDGLCTSVRARLYIVYKTGTPG